jgi:hypothetical protein
MFLFQFKGRTLIDVSGNSTVRPKTGTKPICLNVASSTDTYDCVIKTSKSVTLGQKIEVSEFVTFPFIFSL